MNENKEATQLRMAFSCFPNTLCSKATELIKNFINLWK